MSKLVNWGHWVAAAFFAAWGVDLLWTAIVSFPALFHQHPVDITYRVVSDAFMWIAALLCAWGIVKWRIWARTLGIVLSAFVAVTMGLLWAVGFEVGFGLARRQLLSAITTVVVCFVLIWLFLPSVRAEYSRRNQLA